MTGLGLKGLGLNVLGLRVQDLGFRVCLMGWLNHSCCIICYGVWPGLKLPALKSKLPPYYVLRGLAWTEAISRSIIQSLMHDVL